MAVTSTMTMMMKTTKMMMTIEALVGFSLEPEGES